MNSLSTLMGLLDDGKMRQRRRMADPAALLGRGEPILASE
jgi:hypothetical protein